eukprot:9468819-Pyramimonas_sp.AAC.1
MPAGSDHLRARSDQPVEMHAPNCRETRATCRARVRLAWPGRRKGGMVKQNACHHDRKAN